MSPKGTKQENQTAIVWDTEQYAVIRGLSENLGISRPEAAKRVFDQGVAALHAAAAAEDAGESVDDAVVAAIRSLNSSVDAGVMLHLLDVLNDYLDHVARKRPADAIKLAAGAATALRGWADQQASAMALPDELFSRLKEQDELAARFDVGESIAVKAAYNAEMKKRGRKAN